MLSIVMFSESQEVQGFFLLFLSQWDGLCLDWFCEERDGGSEEKEEQEEEESVCWVLEAKAAVVRKPVDNNKLKL